VGGKIPDLINLSTKTAVLAAFARLCDLVEDLSLQQTLIQLLRIQIV